MGSLFSRVTVVNAQHGKWSGRSGRLIIDKVDCLKDGVVVHLKLMWYESVKDLILTCDWRNLSDKPLTSRDSRFKTKLLEFRWSEWVVDGRLYQRRGFKLDIHVKVCLKDKGHPFEDNIIHTSRPFPSAKAEYLLLTDSFCWITPTRCSHLNPSTTPQRVVGSYLGWIIWVEALVSDGNSSFLLFLCLVGSFTRSAMRWRLWKPIKIWINTSPRSCGAVGDWS